MLSLIYNCLGANSAPDSDGWRVAVVILAKLVLSLRDAFMLLIQIVGVLLSSSFEVSFILRELFLPGTCCS